MKRPWTPGPWLIEGRSIYSLRPEGWGANQINVMYAQFQHCRGGADDRENEANAKLTSKAPDMAEKAIELISECREDKPDYLTIARIAGEFSDILREVGWDGVR